MLAVANVSTPSFATTASPTANLPSGVVAGDLLIAILATSAFRTLSAEPSGFTAIDSTVVSGGVLRTYYRVADGTESSTYSWTLSSSTVTAAIMVRITGADTSSPIDTWQRNNVSSTSVAAPSLTAAGTNELYLTFAAYTTGGTARTWTEPGSMNEDLDSGAASMWCVVADELIPASGATGTRTLTSTAVTSAAILCEAILIKPAVGGLIPLGAASAQSSSSLALTAPTQVPLGAASGLAASILALTAPTKVPLGAASAASSASLALAAGGQVVSLGAASAQSSASLALAAPTQVPLGVASAQASASLAVGFGPPHVPLAPASGHSSATLELTVGATGLLVGTADAWPPGDSSGVNGGGDADQINAFKFTAVASGSCAKIRLRHAQPQLNTTHPTSWDFAVYADSSDEPGALLGTVNVPDDAPTEGTSAWLEGSVTPFAVTSGTPYWLVVRSNGNGSAWPREGLGATTLEVRGRYSSAALPNPWSSAGEFSYSTSSFGVAALTSGDVLLLGDLTEYAPFVEVGSNSSLGVGEQEAFKFTAIASGNILSLKAWINDDAGDLLDSVYLCVYSNSAGEPDALLGYALALAPAGGTGDGVWIQADTIAPIAVVSGTDYWLSWLPQGDMVDGFMGYSLGGPDETAEGRFNDDSGAFLAPPDPFGATSNENHHIPGFQALSTLTPGGGTGPLELVGSARTVTDAWGFLSTELDPRISTDFQAAWESGNMIGADRPEMRVEIRQGRFNRRYAPWDDGAYPVDMTIAGSSSTRPWQAFWEPTTEYVEIPGVLQCELAKNFDQKGIETMVLTIENMTYKPLTAEGEGGTYHAIYRGYMSPLRGYVPTGDSPLTDERGDDVATNEWFQVLNRNYQITVHQAYGDQWVKVFTGLIDDVDATSRPTTITINARDFGQVLSDEEIFGWNKDKAVFDPVTFIDSDEAEKIQNVGYGESASTSSGSTHQPNMVDDGDSDTYWRSQSHTTWTVTEWVQIRVPQGLYEDITLGTEYDDLDVYISVYAKKLKDGSAPQMDGADISEGWVDNGVGTVPGTFGGVPYLRLISGSSNAVQHRALLNSYKLGPDSIIRISLRNLWDIGSADYRGGVRSLYGRKRTLVPEAITQKWVRIGDVSDIVKVVLRWAGFKEWDVESTGVKLGKRFIANRGMKYMDVIDQMKDGVGYEFFMAYPTDDDRSIGIPTFRKSIIIADPMPDGQPVISVTDADLLTQMEYKQTDEPLAYIIRARGKESKNGVGTGSNTTKRIQYEYRPPWSGVGLAGILKHVIHTNHLYKSMDDVKFAAWFIAIQEAIAAISVGVEIPAYPGIDLDDFAYVRDLGTGLITRLSVRERRSTFTRGEQTKWTMSLSGAIVDQPDLQEILDLVRDAKRDNP